MLQLDCDRGTLHAKNRAKNHSGTLRESEWHLAVAGLQGARAFCWAGGFGHDDDERGCLKLRVEADHFADLPT